jgi:hypothetical protein
LILSFSGPAERGSRGTAMLAAAEKEGEKPPAPPPLVVTKDAPRLLDEPAKPAVPAAGASRGPVADNTACYCCHANYQTESFAQDHAKANVGCVECHGESSAHRNDEDNITPPDVIFAPEDIERNCQKCHDTHDAPAVKVIAMWREKCPARTNPKDLLCTDCHGEHRLKFRTVWWDKKTGQLGERKEGERVRWAPDLTKVPAENKVLAKGKSGQDATPEGEMR